MENNSAPHADAQGARESLDAIASVESELADRMVTPWWFYPGVGALEAALVLSRVFSKPWQAVVLVGFLIGLFFILRAYSNRTGLGASVTFVRWAWAPGVLMIAVALGGLAVVEATDSIGVALIAAAVVLVTFSLVGPWVDRAVRAGLRAAR